MGTPDIYGDVQLKVGDPRCDSYQVGDNVPIPDGVYVAYEGVVCVYAGIFFAQFPELHDKWGNELDLSEVVGHNNPIKAALVEWREDRAAVLLRRSIEALAFSTDPGSQIATDLREDIKKFLMKNCNHVNLSWHGSLGTHCDDCGEEWQDMEPHEVRDRLDRE